MPTTRCGVVKGLFYTAVLVVLASCSQDLRQVSESGYGAFEADLEILDADTVAISWYDTRHGQAEIYLRLLDGTLDPKTPEIRLTQSTTHSYEADVVGHGNNLAVTWYEVNDDGSASVWLGLWSREGDLLWKQALTDDLVDARIPVIESIDGKLFVAWLQKLEAETQTGVATDSSETVDRSLSDHQLVGLWLSTENLRRPEIEVEFPIASASATTWNINSIGYMGERGAEVLLTFDAEFETASSELYLTRVTSENTITSRLTNDDGYASKYPDISRRENRLALTWFDNEFSNNEVFLVTGEAADYFANTVEQFMELRTIRVTRSAGDSIGAYISWQGQGPVVAWSDNESGQYQIHRQSFGAEGNAIADAQQLTNSVADSLIPSIAAIADFLYLAWNDVTVTSHDQESNLSRSEVIATRVEYSQR